MRTANQNFLDSSAEVLRAYAAKDSTYTMTAATITTSKFGPSGSLKKKNSVLENTMAVMPNMNIECFLVITLSVTWTRT